ncbi:MAG: hypothetical protein Q8P30_04315 [Candidatus Uhrbacteria bacterium]|nr:hypothetical protein [Candidatus Uhrbacteria bacterium]
MSKEGTNKEIVHLLCEGFKNAEVAREDIRNAMQEGFKSAEVAREDILETINAFATHTETEIGGVKHSIGGLKSEIETMNKRLNRVEALMVTKDYLDEKLWNLKGDMVSMMRREVGHHEAKFHTV